MVRKNRPRSSSLFLMELILGILFFTIASAICVQIFVKSHVMSQESQALNQAVTLCTNAAETFAGTEEENLEQGVTTTYFDQDFKKCKKADASYLLQVDIYKTKQRNDKETRTHVADEGLKSSDLFYADIMVSEVENAGQANEETSANDSKQRNVEASADDSKQANKEDSVTNNQDVAGDQTGVLYELHTAKHFPRRVKP